MHQVLQKNCAQIIFNYFQLSIRDRETFAKFLLSSYINDKSSFVVIKVITRLSSAVGDGVEIA